MLLKIDDFLQYVYRYSTLTKRTQYNYMMDITRCCRQIHTPHILDITPAHITRLRTQLSQGPQNRHVASYNALKYTFLTLLTSEALREHRLNGAEITAYTKVFANPPSQKPHTLRILTEDETQSFFDALPDSATGRGIKTLYDTGKLPSTLSRTYAQKVCKAVADEAGLTSPLGLRCIRSTGLVMRLRSCKKAERRSFQQKHGLTGTQMTALRKCVWYCR